MTCDECERIADRCPIHGGAWVTFYYEVGPTIIAVYPSEIEALRSINGASGQTAVFLPWGRGINEVLT